MCVCCNGVIRLSEIRYILNRIAVMNCCAREIPWNTLEWIIQCNKPCRIIVYVFDHNQVKEVVDRLSGLVIDWSNVIKMPSSITIGDCQIRVVSVFECDKICGYGCEYYYVL